MKDYKMKHGFFDSEEKEDKLNSQCEKKLVEFVLKSRPDLQREHEDNIVVYDRVQQYLTEEILQANAGDIYASELKAFVRVRSKQSICRGKITYLDVPANKGSLIGKCFQCRGKLLSERLVPVPPVLPQLLEPATGDISNFCGNSAGLNIV